MYDLEDYSCGGPLGRLTVELITKHGREKAVRILREFGVEKVPDLKLRDAAAYRDRVLHELARPKDIAPTQEEWEQHARDYPIDHKGMLYRLNRIRRGQPPPGRKPSWV